MSGLYPQDPEAALEVDELIDTVAEVLNSAPQSPDAETKKTLREAWAAGKLKILVNFFSQKVAAANGGFLVGGKLSLADIYVYAMIHGIAKGNFDYVPTDYLAAWPNLTAYTEKLEADPTFGPHKL